jgi:hypothetical protein
MRIKLREAKNDRKEGPCNYLGTFPVNFSDGGGARNLVGCSFI